jgi:hypothetical protein
MSNSEKLAAYIPSVGDMVVVDNKKWRTRYDAKITWLGSEWAQVTSDRGKQTMHLSRLTLKPK